ncbi:hypothetical protein VB773_05970 [Haloarculaceae archaeon H-GB2-1]|nr:hypothetical protein [Haloarculaceae archaeon H-GB1-1]MEA5389108.1 hypothetical protein [Haloarculaceae archaeon H-GB11]MEA5407169.1 hypothetical protein [Haloarculaceae archaeon H-GB2-1]
MSHGLESSSAPFGTVTGFLSRTSVVPLSVRSVFRFYTRSGELDLTALRIRGWVEDTLDAFLEDAYAAIEARVEQELDYESVTFSYETKLTMPVELTLGHLYRRAMADVHGDVNPVTGEVSTPISAYFPVETDDAAREERLRERASEQLEFVAHAERVARLCTEALLDGDMRDAINDDEYEDFQLDVDVTDAERRRVAEIAQECLRTRVEEQFSAFPAAVRERYTTAVDDSEAHQDDDQHFRELMVRATEGDDDATEQIRDEYKFAPFESNPDVLTAQERDWPYCKTQYERVGVIYDGMIEMFRAAGIDIDESFKHAIVLAIIGAQIWLDDVDDLEADLAEQQLTPVTAEYLICDTDDEAYQNVVDIATQYLDQAIRYAVDSDSILTGIATEYIYLSGTPENLDGYDA